MEIRELLTTDDMLLHIDVLNELYPNLLVDALANDLELMISNGYGQVAVFENEECLGLTGFWINKKLWCEKYLEIDNFIVREKHRSKGVGQFIIDYLVQKAKNENCSIITLDSYRDNTKAHQLFLRNEFQPKGIHFVKFLDKSAIR
ncbi:MAG: GNAT family N-acetyltransferase [Bacteroidota bacterium]